APPARNWGTCRIRYPIRRLRSLRCASVRVANYLNFGRAGRIGPLYRRLQRPNLKRGNDMFHLTYTLKKQWPKLAWLAVLTPGSDTVEIQHGPGVETSQNWFSEAAWVGPFAAGDFDQQEAVFGSGGRVREEGITFV